MKFKNSPGEEQVLGEQCVQFPEDVRCEQLTVSAAVVCPHLQTQHGSKLISYGKYWQVINVNDPFCLAPLGPTGCRKSHSVSGNYLKHGVELTNIQYSLWCIILPEPFICTH